MGSRQIVLWSEERDQIIRDNRGKLSASIIAKMIGGGCTRCAVIGRARRLGLTALAKNDPERNIRRRNYGLRKTRSNYQTMPRVMKVKIPDAPPIVDVLIPFDQRKTLLTLDPDDCRWPVGEPGTPEFFFCGAPKIKGRSYCAGHCKRAIDRQLSPSKHFVFRKAA